MNGDQKITPKNQNDPQPARTLFLTGVMNQAHAEGYGTQDQGKLIVMALRIWEER